MKQKELNVRWHSRAGQGAVTAANFFAEALNKMGYKTQSFPDYGAEKRGAPVVVYNRVSASDTVLDDPSHLRYLNLVVLLDPTLVGAEIEYEDVLDGMSSDSILVINTSKKESSKFNDKFKGQIYHLPATKIALDTISRNVPNVAMIGGLTTILDLDTIEMGKILKEHLSGFFRPDVVEKNMIGYERGNKEVCPLKN